jgi:MoaA/NifB/PqqE/SkfB family radical SAM enzyme
MLSMLGPKIVLRAEPHYYASHIAFNARTWKTIRLSSEQYQILRALNDAPREKDAVLSSLDQAAGELGFSGHDLVDAGVVSDFTGGIFSPRPLPDAGDDVVMPGIDCMSSPSKVELCITRRCNQACYHCNVSARSTAGGDMLPTSFWLQMLDDCVASGVLNVKFTGGEPFVRDDFDEILEKAVDLPIATTLLTNGLLLNQRRIATLKAGNVGVAVSLDGINPEQHDAFRRSAGAFDRTVENLRELGEAGITLSITVTVHSANIASLRKFIDIALKVKAAMLVFVPMVAIGRGAKPSSAKYHSSAIEMKDALAEVVAWARAGHDGPEIVIGNYEEKEVTEYQKGRAMSKRPQGFCKAGTFALAVDEDGMVYPCLRGLQTKVHPIGNIIKSSFSEIWRAAAWSPFRDKTLPRVPCRVEAIEKATRGSNGGLVVLN